MRCILVFAASIQIMNAADLTAPADQKMILQAHGVGQQIYTCGQTAGRYEWTLKAPEAKLLSMDGQETGKHFAGPTWKWKDGSAVMGKVTEKKDSPDSNSIPWLMLAVVKHSGSGALSSVDVVRRVNTQGGKAPASGCDAGSVGSVRRVGYEADYLFYAKEKGSK